MIYGAYMKHLRLILAGTAFTLLLAAPIALNAQKYPSYDGRNESKPSINYEDLRILQEVVRQGYANFQQHRRKGTLNDNERKIQTILDETLPALEAKGQKQMELIEEEYAKLLEQILTQGNHSSASCITRQEKQAEKRFQSQCTEMAERYQRELRHITSCLFEALAANQDAYPHYVPSNKPEVIQCYVLAVYTAYGLNKLAPPIQEEAIKALRAMFSF